MNKDKFIPVEASSDGKQNAYYVHCAAVGHARAYASCLQLCANREDSRLNSIYSTCSGMISKRDCPAIEMRHKELEAGHAIYFYPRGVTPVERTSYTAPAETYFAAKPRAVASKSLIDSIDTTTYSEVITRAIAGAGKPKPTPAPVVKLTPIAIKPGESLLDIARRMAAK